VTSLADQTDAGDPDTPDSRIWRICTWNVNSLAMRMQRLEQLLASQTPDLVCLQETKMTDEKFPHGRFAELGYQALHLGQPTYNGVAILARLATVSSLRCLQRGIPGLSDPQQRFLLAEADDLLIASIYVPNGQALDSEKYRYKLHWLEALHCAIVEGNWAGQPLVLAGDYNIAPEDRDVHDPLQWEDQVLCSQAERDAFRKLIGAGFSDALRLHDAQPGRYTWWDYRQLGFPLNRGLRIDHILLGGSLGAQCVGCEILREERKGPKPSDHAPVIARILRTPRGIAHQ